MMCTRDVAQARSVRVAPHSHHTTSSRSKTQHTPAGDPRNNSHAKSEEPIPNYPEQERTSQRPSGHRASYDYPHSYFKSVSQDHMDRKWPQNGGFYEAYIWKQHIFTVLLVVAVGS